MLKKLDDIKKRYEFLSEQLADSAVIADMGTWQRYSKEQSDLTETVEKYNEYLAVEREMEDAFLKAKSFVFPLFRRLFFQKKCLFLKRLLTIRQMYEII